jgi:hypothetical protein
MPEARAVGGRITALRHPAKGVPYTSIGISKSISQAGVVDGIVPDEH